MVRSQPTNEHELAIARIVDKLDIDGKLSPRAIEDVIAVLDFSMSKTDSEFLVSYIRWKMDYHPNLESGWLTQSRGSRSRY